MPKKTKSVFSPDDNKLDGFAQQVELALEHFSDPEWLGQNCLLAAPFVLGQTTSEGQVAESALDRGNLLRSMLQRSVQRIGAEQLSIIEDVYFRRNNNLNNAAIALKRNMSERTFYRWRQQAVISLANNVYQSLIPPMRVEQPPHKPMAGRTSALTKSLDGLHRGLSIYVSGPSGVGKTILGSEVQKAWRNSSFWYTVRPGISDRLYTFVFSLGYYLRELGATSTWRQLLADQGIVKMDRVMSVLRYDLGKLDAKSLLICIDEVDELTPERTDHAQFLHVLDELRNLVPILMIGQRVVLETDAHIALTGFDDLELIEWLELVGAPPMTEHERRVLIKATHGQPALLSLLATLRTFGESPQATLSAFPDRLSLEVLLARIWRRLDEAERQVLTELAVFVELAPIDIWGQRLKVIKQLIDRNLLIPDHRGGVQCDTHLRALIYERTPVELRRALHLHAAVELEKYGQFIHSMHQYLLGNQPAQCVWLWFSRRQQLTELGFGPVALALLEQIVSADLPDERDRTALALARAELLRLVGKTEAIAEALGTLPLGRVGNTTAYAQRLLAEALGRQGEIERALATYRRALETLAGSTPYHQVIVHQKLVHLHLTRSPDLATARKEARLAQFHSESFSANVDEFSGDLEAARLGYGRALKLAEAIEDNAGLLAHIYSHLGMVLLKVGDPELAANYIRRGLELSEQRGDVVGPLYDRINLSYALTMQGYYEEAEKLAREGLMIAERMHHAYLVSGLYAAAGDAALRRNLLDSAEEFAIRSLVQEEVFFRPWALTVLGLVQSGRGQQIEAVKTLVTAVDAARDIEDDYGEAYAQYALGDVYSNGGQHNEAVAAFRRAHNSYASLGFNFEVMRTARRMCELGIAVSEGDINTNP